jgi:hypothetical protein
LILTVGADTRAMPFGVSDTSFGILLGCAGSVFINVGNNLQAVGLAQLSKEEDKGKDNEGTKTLGTRGTSLDRKVSQYELYTSTTSVSRHAPLSPREAVHNSMVSHVNSPEEEADEISACDSPVFVVGTAIFVTGSLLNFAAFAFAPQSILASLEGIQVRQMNSSSSCKRQCPPYASKLSYQRLCTRLFYFLIHGG